MRNVVLAIVAALALNAVAWAKPKSETFKESCKVVFPVALKLASHKPYKLIQSMPHDLALTTETGSFWKAGSQHIYVQMFVVKDGCKVTDHASYSGFRRNGTVFLKRLGKALVQKEDKSK